MALGSASGEQPPRPQARHSVVAFGGAFVVATEGRRGSLADDYAPSHPQPRLSFSPDTVLELPRPPAGRKSLFAEHADAPHHHPRASVSSSLRRASAATDASSSPRTTAHLSRLHLQFTPGGERPSAAAQLTSSGAPPSAPPSPSPRRKSMFARLGSVSGAQQPPIAAQPPGGGGASSGAWRTASPTEGDGSLPLQPLPRPSSMHIRRRATTTIVAPDRHPRPGSTASSLSFSSERARRLDALAADAGASLLPHPHHLPRGQSAQAGDTSASGCWPLACALLPRDADAIRAAREPSPLLHLRPSRSSHTGFCGVPSSPLLLPKEKSPLVPPKEEIPQVPARTKSLARAPSISAAGQSSGSPEPCLAQPPLLSPRQAPPQPQPASAPAQTAATAPKQALLAPPSRPQAAAAKQPRTALQGSLLPPGTPPPPARRQARSRPAATLGGAPDLAAAAPGSGGAWDDAADDFASGWRASSPVEPEQWQLHAQQPPQQQQQQEQHGGSLRPRAKLPEGDSGPGRRWPLNNGGQQLLARASSSRGGVRSSWPAGEDEEAGSLPLAVLPAAASFPLPPEAPSGTALREWAFRRAAQYRALQQPRPSPGIVVVPPGGLNSAPRQLSLVQLQPPAGQAAAPAPQGSPLRQRQLRLQQLEQEQALRLQGSTTASSAIGGHALPGSPLAGGCGSAATVGEALALFAAGASATSPAPQLRRRRTSDSWDSALEPPVAASPAVARTLAAAAAHSAGIRAVQERRLASEVSPAAVFSSLAVRQWQPWGQLQPSPDESARAAEYRRSKRSSHSSLPVGGGLLGSGTAAAGGSFAGSAHAPALTRSSSSSLLVLPDARGRRLTSGGGGFGQPLLVRSSLTGTVAGGPQRHGLARSNHSTSSVMPAAAYSPPADEEPTSAPAAVWNGHSPASPDGLPYRGSFDGGARARLSMPLTCAQPGLPARPRTSLHQQRGSGYTTSSSDFIR